MEDDDDGDGDGDDGNDLFVYINCFVFEGITAVSVVHHLYADFTLACILPWLVQLLVQRDFILRPLHLRDCGIPVFNGVL